MTSTLMSIMGRMSAYSGRPVEWNEAMESEDRLGPQTYALGDIPVPPVSVPGNVASWSELRTAGA